MKALYRAARNIKNSSPSLRRAYAFLRDGGFLARFSRAAAYDRRLAAEARLFDGATDIHDLPPIFHYWSNTHLRPILEPLGFADPHAFFAKYLAESARRSAQETPTFLSLGAGNCDTEVRIARRLRERGMTRFAIECLELNPGMLARGRALAEREEVAAHIVTVEGDFNRWTAARSYAGIMASQSLHHVVELEHLFDEVARGLAPGASFVVDDMIGRNGHLRWPEALAEVQRFWTELPRAYRYNHQLERRERRYRNWDCSLDGFEGIRAEDILPLLIERFDFELFVGFANVIDVFVDRAFGPNFDADAEWDRAFIDRVHAVDEAALRSGRLTPTHMLAVMVRDRGAARVCARGVTPEASVHPGARWRGHWRG